MNLTEKSAYLKGLIEGMGIKEDTNEGKIYKTICDILADIALEIEDMQDAHEELDEAVGAIDEDLADLEECVYGDDDDDDDDDDELYSVTCPACGDEVYLDEDIINEGHIDCPNCGELLEFDFDECDCGCCDHDCDCEDAETTDDKEDK